VIKYYGKSFLHYRNGEGDHSMDTEKNNIVAAEELENTEDETKMWSTNEGFKVENNGMEK
jgi:hypothetical protein